MRYVALITLAMLGGCMDPGAVGPGPDLSRYGTAGVWTAVSAGAGHSCGITTLGETYCWGSSAVGQLGRGVASSAGGSAGCAVTPSGIPYCASPGRVAGGRDFVVVSAGLDHTCGLTDTGQAYCWGRGDEGQLGTFATAERCTLDGPARICSSLPLPVEGGVSLATVVAGNEYSCGLDDEGAAWCWGSNAAGQLGQTTPATCQARGSEYRVACSGTPVRVSGGHRFVALALGAYHACGLTAGGDPFCWGHNLAGQLGSGSMDEGGPAPVAVVGGHRFTALTAGYDHTCGVDEAGQAYCWGGDGPNRSDPRASPEPVPGDLAFHLLTRSRDHTCGLDGAGTAYCWGFNDSGQLGNGEASVCGPLSCTVPYEPDPVRVLGGHRFATLSAGYATTCGTTPAGDAYCWGLNYTGQLGTGSRAGRTTPATVLAPR
jgi:alpha-tubulin suppressor-like RCC1 family protein